MTPDQAGIVIADRFVSGDYTGRDNLALHISSAIQQAIEDAVRVVESFQYPDGMIDMECEELVAAIRALKDKPS